MKDKIIKLVGWLEEEELTKRKIIIGILFFSFLNGLFIGKFLI